MASLQASLSRKDLGSVDRGRRRDEDGDDEEAELWAALERLPTYDRVRSTILEQVKGSRRERRQVQIKDVDLGNYLMDQIFKLNNPDEDNEAFLNKLHSRIEAAGVEVPTVEVRYEDLTIAGKVRVGSRALPTLTNTFLNFFEYFMEKIRFFPNKKRDLKILQGATGILKPGRMTLLLGPPSSGKTTLLLALAGLLDPALTVQGSITYNGHSLQEFEPRKTAAYISQDDLHISELTVRETMDYSARYQGVGTRYDLITELVKREKELGIHPDPVIDFFMKASAVEDVSHDLVTDYTMKIMGLDICSDTVVGDQMIRGISGGQRKRLTTAEMIVGPAKALFMDEISTGLDSSTTFKIVKCTGQVARFSKATVLMSLLQPAPETYNLFDDVILLSGGLVVYHGPREDIMEFFESCGFRCPERKSQADFLQEVTSRKDQQQYWADKSKPYSFVPAQELADTYKNSPHGLQIREELSTPFDKSKSHKAALVFDKWMLPQWDLFKITFQKEIALLKKNYAFTLFNLTQMILGALLASSLFFRTRFHQRNLNDAQLASGALFFLVIIVVFTSYTEIVLVAVRMPIYQKFRQLQFFPPWTWALAMFIVKIPFSIVESFATLVFSYYIIGLAPAPSRFFKLWLLLTLASQMTSGLFRMMGALCRTMVIASSVGGFSLIMVFSLGGYVIPRTDIRGWWIWGYWALPLSYLENGAIVNEFLAHQWNKPLVNDTFSLGHRFILSLGMYDRGYWYWIACGTMIAYTIIFYLLFALWLTFVPPPEKTRALMSEQLLLEIEDNRTGAGVGVSKRAASTLRSIASNGASSGSRSVGRVRSTLQQSRIDEDAGDELMSMPGTSSRDLSQYDDSIIATQAGGVSPKRGMILPFQPLAISFKDINYYVDMPAAQRRRPGQEREDRLQLLRQITGAFRPGVLTALVGVTGAGKSTLMDVLSGRKSKGYVEGEIRISGFPKKQETFARIAGYCEQNDIHSPQITVHESLTFSASLRLSSDIANEMKREFVQQVMDLVELDSLSDALVGVPGESGLSTEQRKRLTIAVELVANPSIIFMDEPTSGLDARAAATVMRTVRNTVDTGRTVVCTIHQPSIDIFEAFDELLLLKRGGETIYAGPLGRESHKLVEYFENISGVPKIQKGENPAAWMLEVSTPGMESKLGVDFAELYRNSSVFESAKALVEELSVPYPNTQDIFFPTRYSQPYWKQFFYCLWKQHWTYWRSPGYNVMRFGLSFMSALYLGTLYWGLGKKIGDQAHLFSLMSAVFESQVFYGILTATAVQPVIQSERTVFYRERSAGMYAELPYAISQCLIEVPYVILSSTLFSAITYPMFKLKWEAAKFFWYTYFGFCSQLTFSFWGMMTVALTPNPPLAAMLAGLVYNAWALFSGFLLPHPDYPVWWAWAYWISPVAYTIYGTLASQLGDLDTLSISQIGIQQSVKSLIRKQYGFRHDRLGFIAAMAFLFPMVFALLFVIFIRYLNYQQR